MHVQELSQAEPHEFMQPDPFAQRLDVPLPILMFDWWDFSVVRGSQWAGGEWSSNLARATCAAVSASARWLSGGIYSIFNNEEVLFPFWVTAASSALSVVSPDLLSLFILIRLALALSEAEDPMSLLIRKWHPLWIRLAAWKVKICQWLQKLWWRRMTVAISYDGNNIIQKESAASIFYFFFIQSMWDAV